MCVCVLSLLSAAEEGGERIVKKYPENITKMNFSNKDKESGNGGRVRKKHKIGNK